MMDTLIQVNESEWVDARTVRRVSAQGVTQSSLDIARVYAPCVRLFLDGGGTVVVTCASEEHAREVAGVLSQNISAALKTAPQATVEGPAPPGGEGAP